MGWYLNTSLHCVMIESDLHISIFSSTYQFLMMKTQNLQGLYKQPLLRVSLWKRFLLCTDPCAATQVC